MWENGQSVILEYCVLAGELAGEGINCYDLVRYTHFEGVVIRDLPPTTVPERRCRAAQGDNLDASYL